MGPTGVDQNAMPPQRCPPEDQRRCHGLTVSKGNIDTPTSPRQNQKRANDQPLFWQTRGVLDLAPVDQQGIAFGGFVQPRVRDVEPDPLFAVLVIVPDSFGMERRGPRARIDLGNKAGQAQFGQTNRFAPSDYKGFTGRGHIWSGGWFPRIISRPTDN